MLPLAGSRPPESVDELSTQLRAGFAAENIAVRSINAEGIWPRVASVAIDLTGAEFSRRTRASAPTGDASESFSIDRLALSAAPFSFEKTPGHFALHATECACGFRHTAAGQATLEIVRVREGAVAFEIQRADLESALKSIAHELLAKQGADVKSLRLDLQNRDAHSLDVRVEVTAKAFLMTARVTLSGRVELDNELNLRARELAVAGDGMIGNFASSFLRPRFAEIEKRAFSLSSYCLAGVKLRDVTISGGDSLRIAAQFGS